MELYDRRGKPIRHARDIRYDNLVSGLSATDLQAAIDELAAGSTSYTDEDARDAVGNILANSATIEFTYDDSTPAITADLSSDVLNLLDLADSAVQPGDLAAVAFTGDYDDLSNTPSIPADLSGLTFVTVDDETSSAANSRQLAAGTNITFDTSTPGRLEISASGGGGGQVDSIVEGFGILVDDSDPENPVISLDETISPTWTGEHTFTSPSTFLDDVLIAGDNVELQIGEDADLRIFHDGTNSVIRNGTGMLSIMGVTGDVAPVHLPSIVDVLLTGTAFGYYRSGADNGAILQVGLYRGSFAAPTPPVTGNGLGFVAFTAHDGDAEVRATAQFAAIASEEWIPGVAHGTNCRVQTVAAGSTAIQTRMLVGANAAGGFVQGPDGVADQPGWSFLNDPDTGIFRPDTNELGIAAGGALVMRIDSRGVVWIRDGITAPGASITGMAGLYIDSADGDLKIRFADGTVKTIVTDT